MRVILAVFVLSIRIRRAQMHRRVTIPEAQTPAWPVPPGSVILRRLLRDLPLGKFGRPLIAAALLSRLQAFGIIHPAAASFLCMLHETHARVIDTGRPGISGVFVILVIVLVATSMKLQHNA